MKIVINSCYGGFSLSEEAYKELGLKWDKYGMKYREDKKRNDPDLIRVVEKLGDKASGKVAKLTIVEIPDDVKWHIGEYDGIEWVAENHRRWP